MVNQEPFYKAYNYAEELSPLLDEVIQQESLTSNLINDVQWIYGTRSFKTNEIFTSGYQYATRTLGWNYGTVGQDEQIYTPSFERNIQFPIHIADKDEAGVTVAKVSASFLRKQAMPEFDAFNFSKIAWEAKNSGGHYTEVTIDRSNVFDALIDDLNKLRKYGAGNLVAYVSSEVMNALELSDKHTAVITYQNNGPYRIDTRIASVNGVRFIEVWDTDRFWTEYDFTDGYKFADESGTPYGKQINYIIAFRDAILCVNKFERIYVWLDGTHPLMPGDIYQNYSYHDLWIKKNQADGVLVSVKG